MLQTRYAFLIVGITFVLFSLRLNAAPIDVVRAKAIAQKHLSSFDTPLRGAEELALVYTSSGIPTRNTTPQQDLYVFARRGREQENGYVVVAGDDNLPEVLGYSYDSRFVTEAMPPQLEHWLQLCAEWVRQVRKEGKEFVPSVLQQETTPITPLLGALGWDQTAPFNNFTPKINGVHTPVGCVATALAQIMRYTCWPRKGRESIKYTTQEGKRYYQQFDTEYDWQHMPNRLTEKSPAAERRAVATLMRDVGMAVKMNYKQESSGAYSENALVGLRKYFRYGNQLQFYMQDFTPYNEWVLLCLNELKAKRPVYYSAAAVGVGHAFVCDGYDGQGRFHFNWGWSGLSNGYFYLTNLAPKAQSTGGGGRGGYVLGSQIITGFQPGDGGEKQVNIVCDVLELPKASQAVTEPLQVAISVWNYDYATVRISPAVQIFDADGNLSLEAHHAKLGRRNFRRGFSEKIKLDISSLDDGTYTVRPAVYLPDRERYYPAHLYQLMGARQFRIEGGRVTMSPQDTKVRLEVESDVKKLHLNTPNKFVFSIENRGALPYRSRIAAIYASTPEVNQSIIARADSLFEHSLSLEPGESQRVELVINGPKNGTETYLHILYDEFGGAKEKLSYQSLRSFPLTLQRAYTVGMAVRELIKVRSFKVYQNGTPLEFRLRVRAPRDRGVLAGFVFAIFDEKQTPSQRCNPIVQIPLALIKPNKEQVFRVTETFHLPLGDNYGLYLYELGSDGRVVRRFGRLFTFSVVGTPSAYALPILDNSAYPEGSDKVEEEKEDNEWTGVEATPLQGVRLFPNPVRGHFTLSFSEALGGGEHFTVEVYGIDGQLQYRAQGDATELKVLTEGWHPGGYWARVCVGARCTVLPFVVE